MTRSRSSSGCSTSRFPEPPGSPGPTSTILTQSPSVLLGRQEHVRPGRGGRRPGHPRRSFPEAFWLVLEGLSRHVLNIASTADRPVRQPASHHDPAAPDPVHFENPGNTKCTRSGSGSRTTSRSPGTPRLPFPAPGAAPITLELDGAITLGGNTAVPAPLELIGGEDPYFTNIDPTTQNVFYLSQDLRVFTATPALNNVPVAGRPGVPLRQRGRRVRLHPGAADPPQQQLRRPDGARPVQLGAARAGRCADRRLVGHAVHLRLLDIFHPQVDNNYNFAIARVRLRAPSGSPAAENVRVFFRLWSTQTADTDYQDRHDVRHLDAAGCRAHRWSAPTTTRCRSSPPAPEPRDPDNRVRVAGVNSQTLTHRRGQRTSGSTTAVSSTCTTRRNVVDGAQIQTLAQRLAPLPGRADRLRRGADHQRQRGHRAPAELDKLAQRNLQVTTSDNPGPASAHRVPQTFDVRPSRARPTARACWTTRTS